MLLSNTVDNRSYSVDLNGDDEQFLNNINNSIGIENAWSIGLWIKPKVGSLNDFGVPLVFSGKSIIVFRTRAANGRIRWVTRDVDGVNIKVYEWNEVLVEEWQFLVCTWDGTDLLFYNNGVDLGPPDNPITDDSGVMADVGGRKVSIGADIPLSQHVNFIFHSTMVWNVTLSPEEILAAYNEGNGVGFNPQANSGNYVSSANLHHWWRFGEDRTELGRDFTTVGTPINIDVNATNISIDDIIVDGPERS